MWTVSISILIVGALFQVCSGQLCGIAWNNYNRCLVRLNQDFGLIHTLTDGQRVQLDTKMLQCFQSQGCNNLAPFLLPAFRNARHACFIQQRNRMRFDLSVCIRRYVPGSILPDEGLEINEWNRYTQYMQALGRNQAVCAPQVNKGQLNVCIREQVLMMAGKTRQPGNQCQTKRGQCDQTFNTFNNQVCYPQWQRQFKPSLCRCIQDLRVTRVQAYKYDYMACVRTRAPRSFIQVGNDDPNVRYFDFLAQKYCNVREICPALVGFAG